MSYSQQFGAGCQWNAPTGRCRKWAGPDDGYCHQGKTRCEKLLKEKFSGPAHVLGLGNLQQQGGRSLADCQPGSTRNVYTNHCIKIGGPTYKKLNFSAQQIAEGKMLRPIGARGKREITKPPSVKQLAARERFAAMAKSGELARLRAAKHK